MELTTEDRQRIEQEAKKARLGYSVVTKWFEAGAEYEHKYQREQQAKPKESLNEIAYRLYKTDYKYVSLDPCKVEILEIYANQLEAERTELRNKVIDECMSIIAEEENDDWVQVYREKLNSLKK